MHKKQNRGIALVLSAVLSVGILWNAILPAVYAEDAIPSLESVISEEMIEQAIESANERSNEEAVTSDDLDLQEALNQPEEENATESAQELQQEEAVQQETTIEDSIAQAVNQASELAFMDETQVAALIAFIDEIEECVAALPQMQSVELQEDLQSLENAKAAAYTMQEALQAQKEDRLDELEQTGVENSWRYQNGQRVDISEPEMLADLPDGVSTFTAGKYWGIDVSHHQSTINWEQVRDAGIDFVIIRCGFGSDLEKQDDKQWQRNVAECERLGIPYGVYLYSYALNETMAYSEAQHTLRLLKGHNPDLPVFLDMEDNTQAPVGNVMLGKIAKVYCDTVQAAGYEVGIYASYSWWTYYLTEPVFENDSWYRWVAQWGSSCSYKKRYEMWQYTETGTIAGIAGRVDMDYWYGTFPGGANTNGLAPVPGSSEWAYYRNGHVDHTYTGLAENEFGLWYVKNGYVCFDANGLVDCNQGWYYLVGGEVQVSYTGLVQNESGWWYVRNGWVDWNYTDIVFCNDAWRYICKGKYAENYSGLAQNSLGWWYVDQGVVRFNHTGVVEYDGNLWYVQNSKLDFSYNGFAQNEAGWWYMQNSSVAWGYTDVVFFNNAWRYICNGRYAQEYTGLAQNSMGWWYVKNGDVDFGYTGWVAYNGGNYWVQNGKAAV